MWFFYVDDTGDSHRIMLTAVAVRAADWKSTLRSWLDWRRLAFQRDQLPAGFELHAQKFVTGRGNPVEPSPTNPRPPINVDKALRRTLYVEALNVIAELPVRIFTIHRHGTDKMAAYRELLSRVESFLETSDSIGAMIVDGLDEGHRAEHRELPLTTRRVLEDPWMQPAHASQLVQIADLIAHAAFQGLVMNPNRAFMWSWYTTILEPVIDRGADDVIWHQAENDTSPEADSRARRR